MINIHEIKHLVKSTYVDWLKQKPAILGAAISFYFIFSLGPILIFTIGFVGMIFGNQVVKGQIVHEIVNIIGYIPAEAIQLFILQAYSPQTRIFTTILSIPMVMFSSTMIFFQLKHTLNIIWGVKHHKEKRLLNAIIKYALSFSMVVILGVLLVILRLKSLFLAVFYDFTGQYIPFPPYLLYLLDTILTFFSTVVLFAMIYKILPDTYIKWGDVFTGALVTSVLFTIGQFAIGIYIGNIDIDTAYGALGSLTVLLIWVYYSSLIFLLGAVFTKTYSNEKALIFKRHFA